MPAACRGLKQHQQQLKLESG